MSDPARNSEFEQFEQEALTTGREALAFTLLRGASNALWIGGAALGVYAEQKHGVSPWLVCPPLAAGVAGIEYAGSAKAEELFTVDKPTTKPSDDAETRHRFSKPLRELGALAYTAWSGAMSAVKVNDTLGLTPSKKRRVLQSATYGVSVSLWASNIPPFKQLRDDILLEGADLALNNPAETLATGAAGSVAIYGVLRGFQALKKKFGWGQGQNQVAQDSTE